MPDGRRPGLWKTLVAAAQTTIERVADGVDALADMVEALADGLRSLGRGSPPPSIDPRFTGMDPALAAYISARDPVWFSFDMTSEEVPTEGGIPGTPDSDVPSFIGRPFENVTPTPTPDAPTSARRHSLREKPSAAELPGGRPVRPPRITFRPRHEQPDAVTSPHRTDRSPDTDASNRSVPTSKRAADSGAEATPYDGATGAPEAPISPTSSSSAQTPAGRARSGARPTGSADKRSTTAFSPFAPTIAVQTRPAAATASGHPRSDAVAPAPWPTFESSHSTSPAASRFPFPPAAEMGRRPRSIRENRPAAVPAPPAARPARAPASPAPWPELPPSPRREPAADPGRALTWGPSASDVLVDEQRSV